MFNFNKEKEFDYYEALSPDALSRAKVFTEKIADLTKKLAKATTNLTSEQLAAQKLTDQLEALKASSSVSLTDDVNYGKFRKSLKEATGELEVTESLKKTLANDVMPKLRTEIAEAEQNLLIILQACMKESLKVGNERIRRLLDQAESERENYISCWRKIFEACSQTLYMSEQEMYPGDWDAKISLRMPKPTEQQQDVTEPKVEAEPEPPKEPVQEIKPKVEPTIPDDGPGMSKGSRRNPEAAATIP